MPHSSEPSLLVTGGSIATTIRSGSRRPRRPRRLQHRPAPERARRGRARTRRRAPAARATCPPYRAVTFSRKLAARCIRFAAVGARVTAVPGRLHQLLQHRVAARRRRHHRPRPRPEPQRELQHVPGVASPLVHLPSSSHQAAVELRPAQALRVAGGKGLRHRPVRPDQPLARRLPLRPPVRRRAGEDARGSRTPSPPAPGPASRRPGRPGSMPPGRPASPPSTCARTHSAPARVLPAPRPPRMTQVVQSPSGGS